MAEVLWENLRPREMEAAVRACPVVYLPFGSLEWHGYHNPLGLDTIKARALCLRAARAGGGILAPATFWPIGGIPNPWTVRMSADLIHSLMAAIFEQMAHVGFRVAIALTGHGGDQWSHLKHAAVEVMHRSSLTVFAALELELVVDTGYLGDHAAKWETSLTQALYPELVDMGQAEPEGEPMDGVVGEDPRVHASPELGVRTADLIVERLVAVAARLAVATPRERSYHIQASAAQVRLQDLLRRRPKPEEYWQGLMALWQGRYADALSAFAAAEKAATGA